ncbi:MAG: PAS domain-containing protein, partial [Bacteroidia bacterium]|nr:PAS domain-containing protein [Bacteroidia bacterium]
MELLLLAAPGRNIPTSVIHMLLTVSGALIIISLLVTYFSLKLRKLNEILLEKNRNITDENKDLQKIKDELAYQKELIAKELYESEEFFRMLLQSVSDGISFYDRDKNLKYANPAFYSITGIERESFTMDEFMAVLHPEYNDYPARRDDELLRNGFYERDISIRHKDGNYVVLSTRSVLVR